MGKQIGSFFTRNYRVLVFLTVLIGLVAFGSIAWNTSANSKQNSSVNAVAVATPTNLAKKTNVGGDEGEIRSPIPTDRVEGDDDLLNYDVRDSPPDLTHYLRPLENADRIALPDAPEAVQFEVFDAVVSNTNPNLTNTDTAGDGETNIAVNPLNPNEIVMTAFSGSWGANTSLWHSLNGGETWTEQQSVPIPPGAAGANGCPCDQSIDYGQGNRMSGTFMTGGTGTTNVYSGITTNPALSASFGWFLVGGNAQRTNATAAGVADQPWLLVNPAPGNASQDNVYVAYDDFTTGPVEMQVSVAAGTNPPNFTTDVTVGVGGGGINPGHRLAENPTTGAIYSIFQRSTSGDDTFRVINYNLNRSTDGGVTWGVNGSPTGIVVTTADSTQPQNKFGTVNALLGGVDHAAVNPATGDLYYVYGDRDSGTGNNRLAIRRITTDGGGTMTVGPEVFINGQVQSALPSVAVNSDGVVGVFYYTYNGMVGGFPQFTARVTFSTDQGATFGNDTALHTFASSATDDGQPRQRVLGDYMQMKAIGRTFFGSYTGNGAQFGRAVSNHDPIFFKIALEQSNTTSDIVSSDSTTVFGEPVTFTATITSPGGFPTGSVNFLDGATPIAGCQNVALLAGVAQCQNVTSLPTGARTINVNYVGDVAFNTSTDSVVQTVAKAPSITTITSDAPDPSVFGQTFPVNFTVVAAPPGAGTPTGNVIVTASGGSETCTGTVAAGTCNIKLSGVGIRTLTASYQSDANFLASSDTESHQVDKANTTTTVTAVPVSPSTFGQSVTFTATIAIQAPGAGPPNPTGTVTFNIDGNLYCVNTPVNASLQATCTQAGLPALPAGLRDVVAIYSGDGNYNGSVGDLNYTVNKASTTTTIVSDLPDPSLVNQPYTVTWAVAVTAPGAGTPTGTVTVDGGVGGGSCTAPVASLSCQVTPTTVGVKIIQATYNGDANFNGSASATTQHTVNLQISGIVRRGPALTPVLGEPVFLTGCANLSTTTNASGAYSFNGAFSGNCTVFPNSALSEPYERIYTSVTTNITNADFVIYSSAADFPRKIGFPTQYVVPGDAGSMPVIMESLDNEASVAFTFTYDINPFSQPPVVVCGANAPGCTITNNTSIFGRVGFTVTPAAGGFSRPDGTPLEGLEAAGPKEIAKINFLSVGTALPSTDFVPLGFGSTPVAFSIIEKVTNNTLNAVFLTPARVVFAKGLEGDVTTRNAGNGTFEATDVVQMRRFVTGLDAPVATHNEYQRADAAPSNSRGDGVLNASDLVQVRRFVAGLDASQPAGGAGAPNPAPIAPPASERPEMESEISIGEVTATNNSRVRIPVDLRSNGSEVALSFTVRYDERKLSDPTVELAAGLPDGVTLTTNAKEPGVIRILIDAASTVAYNTKAGQTLVELGFKVLNTAPSGEAILDIEDLNVSDAAANSTPSKSTRGVIRIDGPNPAETEAKIGGRVTPDDFDLVEEWLDGSIVTLRPRLDGEVKTTIVQPGRRIER